jgi:hypothetical protein
MTVHGVEEFVRHRVVDGAAEAFSGKLVRHDLSPSPVIPGLSHMIIYSVIPSEAAQRAA